MTSEEERSTSRQTRIIVIVLLAAAMLFAAFARTHGIIEQTLTTDELSTWHWAKRPLADHFHVGMFEDQHPPGYIYLVSIAIKLFGDSQFVMRAPSVILGVLVIPLFFLFGRRLYSTREGVVAAALVAVLWQPIFYSQIVRHYSLMLFLAVATTHLWYLLLLKLSEEQRLPRPTLLLYILSASAIMWSDYFGVILVLCQGLGALLQVLRKRRARWVVVGLYTVIGLTFVAWVPAILRHGQLEVPRLERKGPEFLMELLVWNFNESVALTLLIAALGVTALALALFQARKEGDYSRFRLDLRTPAYMLLLWLVVPYIPLQIKSWISQPVLQCKSLIVCTPAAILLASRFVCSLPLPRWARDLPAVALVAAFVVHLYVGIGYPDYRIGTDYLGGAREVMETFPRHPDVVIFACNKKKHFNYYFQQFDSPLQVEHTVDTLEDLPRLQSVLQQENKHFFWLLSGFRRCDSNFVTYLFDHYPLVEAPQASGMQLWLFEDRAPTPEEVQAQAKVRDDGVAFSLRREGTKARLLTAARGLVPTGELVGEPILPEPASIRLKNGCLYMAMLGALEPLADRSLVDRGYRPVSPLVATVDGALLEESGDWAADQKRCDKLFADRQNRFFYTWPGDGMSPQQIASRHRITVRHEMPVMFYRNQGWWVYPGTTLTLAFQQGWDPAWGDFIAQIVADPVLPGPGVPAISLQTQTEAMAEQGDGLLGARLAADTPQAPPWQLMVSSPADGPTLLITSLILGEGEKPVPVIVPPR